MFEFACLRKKDLRWNANCRIMQQQSLISMNSQKIETLKLNLILKSNQLYPIFNMHSKHYRSLHTSFSSMPTFPSFFLAMNRCQYCGENYLTINHHCLEYFKLIKKRKHIKEYSLIPLESELAKEIAITPRRIQATIGFNQKIIIRGFWPPLFAKQELSDDLINFGDPNGEKRLNSILQDMAADGENSPLQVHANIRVISGANNNVVLKALPAEILVPKATKTYNVTDCGKGVYQVELKQTRNLLDMLDEEEAGNAEFDNFILNVRQSLQDRIFCSSRFKTLDVDEQKKQLMLALQITDKPEDLQPEFWLPLDAKMTEFLSELKSQSYEPGEEMHSFKDLCRLARSWDDIGQEGEDPMEVESDLSLNDSISQIGKISLDVSLEPQEINPDIIYKSDYGVKLHPETSRSSMEAYIGRFPELSETKTGDRTWRLEDVLVKHLKKKHPIHAHVANLEIEQVYQLLELKKIEFSREARTKAQSSQRSKLIKHYFDLHSDAPRTRLRRDLTSLQHLGQPEQQDLSQPTEDNFLKQQSAKRPQRTTNSPKVLTPSDSQGQQDLGQQAETRSSVDSSQSTPVAEHQSNTDSVEGVEPMVREDYSVSVNNFSRDALIQKLSDLSIPCPSHKTERMKNALRKYLEDKHPICNFIDKLTDNDLLDKLLQNNKIKTPKNVRGARKKAIEKQILRFYFDNYPQSPLTHLMKDLSHLQQETEQPQEEDMSHGESFLAGINLSQFNSQSSQREKVAEETPQPSFAPTLLDEIANGHDFSAAQHVNQMSRDQILHHLSRLDAPHSPNSPDERLKTLLVEAANSFHGIYKFVKNIDIYDIDILCLDLSLYIGSSEKSEEALHKKAFADLVLRKFHQQPHPALALKDLMETRNNKAHKTLEAEYRAIFDKSTDHPGNENNMSQTTVNETGDSQSNVDLPDNGVSLLEMIETNQDFPMELHANIGKSAEDMKFLLAKLQVTLTGKERDQHLRTKLATVMKNNHPVHFKLQAITKVSTLYFLAKAINIPHASYVDLSISRLRTIIRDLIYTTAPYGPLAYLQQKMPQLFDGQSDREQQVTENDAAQGLERPAPAALSPKPSTSKSRQAQPGTETGPQQEAMDAEETRALVPIAQGFEGIRLPNPSTTNRCYLNVATNLLLNIPATLNAPPPNQELYSQVQRVLWQLQDGSEKNTELLRKSLNNQFHAGTERFERNRQDDAFDVIADVLKLVPDEEKIIKRKDKFICQGCGHESLVETDVFSPFAVDVVSSTREALFDNKDVRQKDCKNCNKTMYRHDTTTSYDLHDSTTFVAFKCLREVDGKKTRPMTPDIFLDSADQTLAIASVIVHTGKEINQGHYRIYHYQHDLRNWDVVDDDKIVTSTINQPKLGYIFLYKKVPIDSPLHKNNRVAYNQRWDEAKQQERQQPKPQQQPMEQEEGQQHQPNQVQPDPPMESEYAKKKAQKEMESEDRLLEKLHHNIAVLKRKRLYAVRNAQFHLSHNIVLMGNNPMITLSKQFLADLTTKLQRPKVIHLCF